MDMESIPEPVCRSEGKLAGLRKARSQRAAFVPHYSGTEPTVAVRTQAPTEVFYGKRHEQNKDRRGTIERSNGFNERIEHRHHQARTDMEL